jgi:hypothetical protein
VFDTVASLSNPVAVAVFAVVGLLAMAGIATLCWWLLPLAGVFDNWLAWVGIVVATAAVVAGVWLLAYRIRWEIGLKNRKWWQVFHVLNWRMKFYDMSLNTNVGFARHALAIDETREAFDRVPWGMPGEWPQRPKGQPEWFQQIWFAGNHSDIGGSYPEDESRLSDISLQWMMEAASSVGLKHDPSVLKLYPHPVGPQHDETRKGPFKYAGKIRRKIVPQAPLHESVIRRFEAAEVLQYDLNLPYRPENLREHEVAGKFFSRT